MEDSVGEEERREQGETVAQAKAHQEEARETAAAGGGEPAEEGGFLSALASKIGATMSGTNGSGGEANATAASAGEEGKRGANGEPGEESGFLSAMASKIGAAMSGANGGSVGGASAAVASDGEDKKDDGNGGGGIFHKLLSGSPPTASPASGAMETQEVKGEERGHEVAGEQAGILSTMATRIGMAMSSANGNENLSGDDAKMSNGEAFHGSKGEDKEEGDEANGGGILSAMASKIGMAISGANGEDNHHGGSGDNAKTSNGSTVDGSKEEEKRNETNGGGILSSVASKIGMAVSGANGNGEHSTEDNAKMSNGDAVHGSKGEEKEKEKGHDANGAGIVEQIISNLPSDDQAPDSDEASLLIAIIED